MIAGPAEDDAAAFAGLVGDWADASLSGELVLGLEALAHVADFAIGQFADGVFDARGKLGDLSDQLGEDGGEGAHELALGVGFAVAGRPGEVTVVSNVSAVVMVESVDR